MTEVGRLIADRYRLTEHIGSGAMGVVWQAHDERLHRTVALKQLLLQPGLSAGEAHEARERAMREGRIAARLQHPNAVAVYDVVEDAGQPVLIMEYVPSKSLSAVLDERGPLSPAEVARIGAQVATALTAAHAAGIVHRDIKPGNVLLAEDGTVKITDFGISRATGDVTVTATGMLAGTPAYLAPEVAKGENPGPPSDVFSLASTVYAAVEGQPPFGLGDNTLALLHAVAACRTIPPRKAGPLTALLMHMLRPMPDDRPTMAEACRALTAIGAGQSAIGLTSGPTAVVEQGPNTPPRPDLRAMPDPNVQTVRTWQQPPPPQRPAYPVTPPGGMRPQPAGSAGIGSMITPVWRKRLLTALAIIVAAVIGILVANAFVDTSGDHAAADPGVLDQTAASEPPATEPAAAPVAPTTTWSSDANPADMTTTAITPGPGQLTAQAMMAVLHTYLGFLPDDPAQAWGLLTPAEQARSGGFGKYQQTWQAVQNVQLDGATPHGPNAVLARIKLNPAQGPTTDDFYNVQFVSQNGSILINDFSVVGKPVRHG
ncbi:MAG TPA: serine/threonine-protein kinase [Pseudonocardiaceae bacterium]|nr:serine/threonine-protein kinase [Pseudonocardiaceae bacterium]